MEARRVSSGFTPIPPPCARSAGRGCLLLALVSTGIPPTLSFPSPPPEDGQKSAIILSFLRFSEWPSRTTPDLPLTVGVLPRPGLVPLLRRTLESKVVNNRVIRVIELQPRYDARCGRVVFLATSKTSEIRQALQSARAAPILAIGEADRFLEYGGAVNLILVDRHIAFEVILKALECSGVTISSKLLRYGQVGGRPSA
jgi:hypothetical protein